MLLTCQRCGARFDTEQEGRAGIYLEPPGVSSTGERLERQVVAQLCGDCSAPIWVMLGLVPPG